MPTSLGGATPCATRKGRAMLGELAGQLQRLGAYIADVADALGLTAARIMDQMAAPSVS